jgi:hypothetical protein
MSMRMKVSFIVIGLVASGLIVSPVTAQEKSAQEKYENIEVPQPTVPGLFTISGQFVRIAYNNEGWVTLGYRTANDSQGQDWMLLEVGVTVRKPTKNQTLTRDSFWITLPNGENVTLSPQKDYQEAGYLRALNMRGNTVRDSINYFPVEANQACALGFFSDPTNEMRSISYDQFEISWQRACLGRLFFKVPGGITTGQYWLHVQFAGSEVQTPFRIMTKDEEKFLKKNWKDLKKEHEKFLKQEAEKAKQQQQQ